LTIVFGRLKWNKGYRIFMIDMREETSEIEVKDMGDGNWYWVSRKIFDDFAPKIGVIGFALYNAYTSYARDKGVAKA